ncbi:MAG: GAF sensor signal transduction histidine kinase [Chloroflexi bacterium OLB15]|nr:MAG: GAF sensor signal transduction histidine kinase [Chloroflexi bacterium OLB15]
METVDSQPYAHPLDVLKLMEFIPDAALIFEPDGERVLEVNQAACTLYGYTRAEFLALSLEAVSLDIPEGRQQINKLLDFQGTQPVHFEATQIRKDHSPVVVDIQAQLIDFQGQTAILSINRDITQLKRAERALEQSEERFGRIFHASPAPTALITPSGWVVDANASFFTLVGLPDDRVINKNVHDLKIFTDGFASIIQRLFEQHHISNLDTPIHSEGRETRETLASFEWIKLGGELCILAQFFDLTERKHSENELRLSESRYRALLEEANRRALELTLLNRIRSIVVREMDQQAAIRAVVEGLHEIYGYSHVSLYLVNPDTGDLHLQHHVNYEQVIEVMPAGRGIMGRTAQTAQAVLIKDVTQEPAFIAAIPNLQSEITVPLLVDGQVVGVLNVETTKGFQLNQEDLDLIVAISEHVSIAVQRAGLSAAEQEQRQRAQELAGTNAALYAETLRYAEELERRVDERTAQLQQAKDQVEAVLNASSDGILLLNASAQIRQANPAFALLFGYSPASGEPFTSFVNPSSREILMTALERAIAEGQVQRCELIGCRRDDTRLTLEAVIDLVRGNAWAEPLVVCNLRDISQRRKLENDLREALDKERRLVELKSRFGAMASHEFRTPLALIRTSSDLLMHHYDRLNETRRQEHFAMIATQVQQLASLIDDLLTISRADTVGTDFRPQMVDLPEYCAEITREIQWIASSTHRIGFACVGDFKPVMIDPAMMRRALINLLNNAIKYSPNGNAVQFLVSYLEHEGVISFQIHDQGIGIPAEDQRHLFDTFYRASNTTHIQGTGLGLAIVKRAVEAHGGTVKFNSIAGQGTTFIITIPIRRESAR